MSSLVGEAPSDKQQIEQQVWEKAKKIGGVLDLSGARLTYATLLHELEKHQTFIEADNRLRPAEEAHEDTMSPAELEALATMRKIFPSEEDREWRRSFGASS